MDLIQQDQKAASLSVDRDEFICDRSPSDSFCHNHPELSPVEAPPTRVQSMKETILHRPYEDRSLSGPMKGYLTCTAPGDNGKLPQEFVHVVPSCCREEWSSISTKPEMDDSLSTPELGADGEEGDDDEEQEDEEEEEDRSTLRRDDGFLPQIFEENNLCQRSSPILKSECHSVVAIQIQNASDLYLSLQFTRISCFLIHAYK